MNELFYWTGLAIWALGGLWGAANSCCWLLLKIGKNVKWSVELSRYWKWRRDNTNG